ncbi:MAG: hypothetical protein QG556_378 [Pseudomonadota bacterium]|nr:hypothetical protein [Pseudomonadota bacterium]
MTEDEEIAAFLDSREKTKTAPTETNEDDEILNFVMNYEKGKELEKIKSAKPTDIGSFVPDTSSLMNLSQQDIEKKFLESREKPKYDPLGALAYKYSQGMTGGLIDPIIAKIAQYKEGGDIPSEYYQKAITQNASNQSGATGNIAELLGALNPSGVFAKTGSAFGVGKTFLGKLAKSIGNEAVQQGGLRTVGKMIENDGAIDSNDIGDIANQTLMGGAFGAGGSLVGQTLGAGANVFRKTELGEKTAKVIGDLYDKVASGKKIDVDQIDSTIEGIQKQASKNYSATVKPLLGKHKAITKNSLGAINDFLENQKLLVNGKDAPKEIYDEVLSGASTEYKNLVDTALALRKRLTGSKTSNIPIKTTADFDDAKQRFFEAVKAFKKSGGDSGAEYAANNLYSSIKKDIVESVVESGSNNIGKLAKPVQKQLDTLIESNTRITNELSDRFKIGEKRALELEQQLQRNLSKQTQLKNTISDLYEQARVKAVKEGETLSKGWSDYADAMDQISEIKSAFSKNFIDKATDEEMQKKIVGYIGNPQKINMLVENGVPKESIKNTMLNSIIKKSKDLDDNFDIRKIKRDILDNQKTWDTLGVGQEMKELAGNLDSATIQKISKVALPTRGKATSLAEMQQQGVIGFAKEKAQSIGLKGIEKLLYGADKPATRAAVNNAIRLILSKQGN